MGPPYLEKQSTSQMSKQIRCHLLLCIVTFGGPKFLLRMLPVSGLDAPFQFDETQKIIECVKDAGGSIFCIISANNRVNQAFFASFDS